MKVKKWLLGLVTFAAMAVLCVVCAGAEIYGDFEYWVQDDGTVEITDYTGSAKKVNIPAKIDGKSVTSIGNMALRDCTGLISITIPNGVTSIGEGAFFNCTSLTSITIPNSVTKIDWGAFSSCTSLTSITIPSSVTSIGSSTFDYCTSLKSITIPNGVTSIGEGAFDYCTSLTAISVVTGNKNYVSLNGVLYNKDKTTIIRYPAGKKDKNYTIPDGVTRIGGSAFECCTNLTSITIPDSVTDIGSYAFENCTDLKSITIPNSVTEIGYAAFRGCTSLKSITIQNSVTSIGEGAFYNCTSLTSIIIPNSVTSISGYAFSGCTSLTSITIPNSVTSIGDYAFEDCTSLTSITIPNGVTSIVEGAFEGCTSLTSITIPNSVTKIDWGAFNNCTSLASVSIPNSVTEIGGYAFYNCSSLENITIPDSVTSIDSDAFSSCTSLTAINVETENKNYASVNGVMYNKDKTGIICYPAGKKDKSYKILDDVTDIYSSAFSGCISLANVTIPDSVTYIGESAFSGCTSLASVTIPNSVTWIGSRAFGYCTSLKSITIPDSVWKIDDYTFRGCTSLASVTIPDSVWNIGNYTFSGCTSLTNITLSDSVGEIGRCAFEGCTSLTAINVATGNQNYVSVNGVLFYKDKTTIICYPAGKKDKSYNIPSSVKNISGYAFSGCVNLQNVKIPDGMTKIDERAFSNCTSLTSITIPDNITSIGECAFEDSGLTSVKLPEKLTDIDVGAFAGTPIINNQKTEIKYIGSTVISCDTDAETLTVGDDVTTIASNAFVDYVYLDAKSTTGGDGSFTHCDKLKSIIIPKSVKYVGKFSVGYLCRLGGQKIIGNGCYKIDDFIIKCYSNSAAEQYAKDNGFDYVLLDKSTTLAKVTGVKLGGRAADALRINWAKNTNADGYIVEMYQGNKWVRVAKITSNNTTTFRKAGLKAGTAYKFRVKAYKMSGKTAVYSAYSATVAARTNPSVIKGAKLSGRAADALRINWTKNASADGYIVEMYKGGKWVRAAKITNNSTTTFRKAGLKASTVYKFRVRAYKMSGKTALYGNYSATVTARTNPSIVKGVKIGGKAKDALRVNWAKNTSAQGYIVEMYKGGKWVRVAKITNGNTTTYRKAGLAKNTAYKFRVKAYYMSGKTALYGNYGSVSGRTAAK